MGDVPALKFYNTLTREKAEFKPIDSQNVRMYVCGPTVYDFAHIGNARPVIVFDVLYRLLRHVYGDKHVTYVRNITDVDDKINARALRDFPGLPLNDAIRNVTEKTEKQFMDDAAALGCLSPDVQPRATENIVQMIEIIQRLLDRGNAYVTAGAEGREVLFSVPSMPDYGQLSKRKLEDQQAGARIAVEAHKRNPGDFVLWKESAENEPGWHAEFVSDGQKATIFGRPGWHIECSAMSQRYLGDTFDIHGGGLDLIFPHHENEIAQSRCANGTSVMANVWMHNGFLQVEGKKMSKSEGNFVTIAELLHTDKFGGRRWPGEVLRLAMLMTHYREPIDFSVKRLEEAEFILGRVNEVVHSRTERRVDANLEQELLAKIHNDLDFSSAISIINTECKNQNISSQKVYTVYKYMKMFGFKFKKSKVATLAEKLGEVLKEIQSMDAKTVARIKAVSEKNPKFPSGKFRPEFELMLGLQSISKFYQQLKIKVNASELQRKLRVAESSPNLGSRALIKKFISFREYLDRGRNEKEFIIFRISHRLELLKSKNFAEADKIRDELLAQGIQLKDGKDPATGERVTTWEVKR